jgi:hypothetical protein
MKRTCCFVTVSLVAFASLLFAADFWKSKDYSTWDEKETLKMLDDSPWAKKTRLRENENAGGFRGGFSGGRGGGRGGMSGGSDMSGSAPAASPGSDSSDAANSSGSEGSDSENSGSEAKAESTDDAGSTATPKSKSGGFAGGFAGGFGGGPVAQRDLLGGLPMVVLRWQSALPVKQAMARYRFKDAVKTSKEAADSLSRQESVHILGVIGMPGRVQSYNVDEIMNNAELIIEDRPAVKPTQVIPQQEGDQVGLYIIFPKYNPDGTPLITLQDKNVEVSITAGRYDIKKKFSLKDMVYQDKLEF